jgi:hypothetical protein
MESLSMQVNRSAPTATIVPILIYEDVSQALTWLCGAFGSGGVEGLLARPGTA